MLQVQVDSDASDYSDCQMHSDDDQMQHVANSAENNHSPNDIVSNSLSITIPKTNITLNDIFRQKTADHTKLAISFHHKIDNMICYMMHNKTNKNIMNVSEYNKIRKWKLN